MLNIEESNQILHVLLQIRRIGYAITDSTGAIVSVNGDTSFIDPQRALGQPITTVIPELIGCETELDEILAGILPHFNLPLVNRSRNANGRDGNDEETNDHYVSILILPHHDQQSGAISGHTIFAEDATEDGIVRQRVMQQRNELTLLRAQLERQNSQLQAANQELQQLDKLKSRFVAVAAHELRTPLTSISGYTELLSDGSYGLIHEDQRRPLQIITQSTARLLLIINNLLDISRIEAGRMQLHLRPVAMGPLLHRYLEEERLQIKSKAQSIRVELPDSAPDLLCDEARTMQILGNLISNASKYTPEGGAISVNAALADQSGYVRISVEDNGIGIPPEEQEHIFETFYRASNANKVDSIGAGLGLHITRSLVELQGGNITCTSVPGRGATFAFTVPLAE